MSDHIARRYRRCVISEESFRSVNQYRLSRVEFVENIEFIIRCREHPVESRDAKNAIEASHNAAFRFDIVSFLVKLFFEEGSRVRVEFLDIRPELGLLGVFSGFLL